MRAAVRSGIALVAALLTLASLSALALATTLLLSFDLELAENRQEHALARAQSLSRLSLVLLALEESVTSGELPQAAPQVPGLVEYRREGATSAVVRVEGAAGSGRFLSGARVDLRFSGGGWRVHIVERR